MIRFDKLWDVMKEKGTSQYQLIYKYGFSRGQLDRIRKNRNITMNTLNVLCDILKCDVEDIAEYVSDQDEDKQNL